MYKYILYDFDGTIADTNELIIQSLNEVSKRFLGKELSSKELNSILGKHLADQMKALSERHYIEMTAFYKEYYDSHKDLMVKEFAGISDMIRELKTLECVQAIVSAKGRGGILHGLELLGLSDFFDVIISAYDIENNKPHPEPALKAMETLGAAKESSLLIGDSPYDIICGKNAGIKTVLVGWTTFDMNELLKHSPDFVISTPGELIDIVSGNKNHKIC